MRDRKQNYKFGLSASVVVIGSLLSSQTAFAQINDDEIVVTARKVTETAMDAPIAITAFSQSTLEDYGIEDLREVAEFTPGIQLNGDFGRNAERPVVRGLSNARAETPQPVSVFIDGVYIRRGITSNIVDNVERIEVLKGPQSALYGRSTYGGVINYITKTPGDETGGKVNVSAATDDDYVVSGYIDGPITKSGTVKGTIGGRFSNYGGSFDNVAELQGSRDVGEEKTTALYGKLLFEPVDNFSAQISVNWSKDEDGQFAGQLIESDQNSQDANSPCPELTRGAFCGTINAPDEVNVTTGFDQGQIFNPASGPVTAAFNFDAGLDREILRIGGVINYETDSGYTLTSLTGITDESLDFATNESYSDVVASSAFGPRGGALIWASQDMGERNDFYQEFRLASPTDKDFDWLVGTIYYGNESNNTDRDIDEVEFTADAGEIEQEIAIFGRLGYSFSDRFNIGLEGRYYWEEVVQAGSDIVGGSDRKAKFSDFSPRVTLDYDLNDETLLYAVAARGNKRGGFNDVRAIAPQDTFNEETVWSYEAGIKSSSIENLSFTASAYYQQVKNGQLSQLAIFNAGTPEQIQITVVDNIGETDIFGLELDGRYDISDNFYVRGTYAFTDTNITEGSDPTQGGFFASDTLVGFDTPRVSKHSATLSAEFTNDLNALDEGEFYIRGDGLYNSGRYAALQNIIETPDALVLNARIGVRNDNWDLSLFGKNITDEDAPGGAFRYVRLRDFQFFGRGSNVAFLRRGAQFGARAIYNF